MRPFTIAKRGIGLVPQGRRIFPSLSVQENLTVSSRERRKSNPWTLDRVYGLFPILKERAKNTGTTLSGGEQQMLAIARALMTNADLLLMDEPSEGLAPLIVREIGDLILTLKQEGLSMLLVEQNVAMATRIADYVYVISNGHIVFEGDVSAFNADATVQEQFIGVQVAGGSRRFDQQQFRCGAIGVVRKKRRKELSTMAATVPGVPNPIRYDDVVENYKALQKTKPEFTFEYGLKSMLTIFTLHDFSMFHVLEEEFGTEKAVNLYAKIWERRTDLEWPGLKEAVGLKLEDPVTMDDFAKIMEIYFDTFGNPIYLAEKSDDRYTFRVTDCPYTTEVLWKMYSAEENLAYNDKIQVACNTAIFERFLELSGLVEGMELRVPLTALPHGAVLRVHLRQEAFLARTIVD